MAWNYNVELNQLLFNKRQPCKQRGRQPKEREASDFCWICRIHVNFKIECRNVWQVLMVCWMWRLSTTIEKKFFFRMDDSSCTVSLNQWNLKRELVLQKRWLKTWLKSCPLINSPQIIVRPNLVFSDAATRNDYHNRWHLSRVTHIFLRGQSSHK